MLKFLIVLGAMCLTSCIHIADTDLEYRVKILEKRMKLLELDLQYIMDECAEFDIDGDQN